ncbi:hypothetical protein BTO30_00520 [Domibacillus antri]|uniref:Uncharacterized protein n=1 Tax=Domibacillus antri TaxID=1714264 RepID=A0A1Q8Q9D6_9BACI|nr:hypothetical protein [Domibacillus antri]OLN23947.1 hypothetical protein BTO30_00520 [Domibacillus antri]
MKKRTKYGIYTALAGVGSLGLISHVTTIESNAIGFGGGSSNNGALIHETSYSEDGETVMSIKFNPGFNNGAGSPQSRFYQSRGIVDLYREVYFPENRKLPGGFVWYSVVPRDYMDRPLKEHDLSLMLENRQTAINGGNYIVNEASRQAYRENLKYGAIDPWTGRYQGKNTGTQTIKYGAFKNKKYEWRFLGYTQYGSAVGNPYFPDDEVSNSRKNLKTKSKIDYYWAHRNWIEYSWTKSYSINAFGGDDRLNDMDRKVEYIKKYFLPQYPGFAKVGNANYWAKRLRLMSNPETETGIWLGWHGSKPWYKTFITEPAKQPNLRLVDYKIYDSENKLVARQTRNTTDYYKVDANVKINSPSVRKGETYRIEVDVKNMPHVKKDIKDMPIQLEHMYSYDDTIGLATGYSTPKYKDTADAPNQNNLKSGGTAHFSYTFTVPTTAKPKDKVQFNARIPGQFFTEGYNTNQYDDESSIILEIAPENLGVKFDGYYDMEKNLVDYVTPNYDMFVKYRVTKTDGTMPVDGADLKIKLTDTKTVTTNQTYSYEGVYDKYGKPIPDGKLKKPGDYAVFWAGITPRVPKMCTQASIPSKWANSGLNGNPADDVAKPPCLVNPDNIVVSNFVAKPGTVWLGKTQSKKSVQYTVNFNLTNFNYDKKNKDIPLVYTIDGKIVKTETVPVQSLKTMKISRILPPLSLGEGEHIVQVEANPAPRKYIEVKRDAYGKEVNPYTDNIGFDRVHLKRNADSFYCPAVHTSNYWNTTFTLSYWTGYIWSHSVYDSEGNYSGSHTHYDKNWRYEYPTVSFYERHKVEKILFRSKYTTDKQGGWVDLLSTKGTIKAGYGFELKVVTSYKTNTYNDTPKPYDNGFWSGRHVSPGYSWVDSSARLKITMPMVDDMGKPIALELDGSKTGSWYNNTTTYDLEPRTVINNPERKVYINENTKDGNYNVRIETEPFYGSPDKPYTPRELCDIKNVTIEVKGSYLDDLKTHIVQ